jgi:hypothetical protein
MNEAPDAPVSSVGAAGKGAAFHVVVGRFQAVDLEPQFR